MLNYKFQFVDGKSDRHIKCQQKGNKTQKIGKGGNVVEKHKMKMKKNTLESFSVALSSYKRIGPL